MNIFTNTVISLSFLFFMANALADTLVDIPTEAPQAPQVEELEVIGRTIDNGSSATTFAIEELERLPGGRGDVLSAIQIVSGVAPPQGGSFGPEQGYYIRGSNLNDNQYVIDWLPVGYIFHYGGELAYSVVNSQLIDGFDLILGGFSPKYGNYTGGVIDVRLRAPDTDEFHHSYKFGTEIGFLLEGPLASDTGFWFAARRSYFDFFLNNLEFDTGSSFTQFPKFYDIQARLRTDFDDGFLDLTVISSEDETGIFIAEDETDPTFAGQAIFKQHFTVYGLRWIADVGGWYQSSQYINYLFEDDYVQLGTQIEGDRSPGDPYGIDTQVHSWEFLSRHEFYLHENHQFFIGIDVRLSNADIEGYITAPPSNDSGSQFIDLFFAEKTYANESLEVMTIEPFWTYTFQNEHALISFGTRGSNTTLRNNVATATYAWSGSSDRWRFEFPILADDQTAKAYLLYGNYLQIQDDLNITESFGSPASIELLHARHRVIGFSGTSPEDWFWKVDLWDKDTYNLAIQPSSGCIQCVTDTGIGYAFGLDLEFRKNFSVNSSIYIALSRSRGERQNSPSERIYPYGGDQPNSFNIAFSDDIYNPEDNWTWGLRAILHDGQPYTRVIGRIGPETITIAQEDFTYYEPIYEDYKDSRLPFYFQLDLSFQYTDPIDDITYKLELNSLSDFVRVNISEFEYGDNYENYNNPTEDNEGFFFPAFIIEAKF